MIRSKYAPVCFVALGFLASSPSSRAQQPNQPQQPMVYEDTVGGLRVIEEGQPPVMIHATLDEMKRFRETHPNARPGQVQAASPANDLYYHGGVGGIGVETAPKIYLVLWGSQWNGNDPSGEAGILENLYNGVGGSSWLNSVTQYCQGVASGTYYCNGAGTAAGNKTGIFAGVWADNASSAPPKRRQSQIAAEARSGCGPLRQHHCCQQRQRAIRDRHCHGKQFQWIRETILRLSQLHQFDGRQRRLHQSAIHHRRRRELRRQFQRARAQGWYHDCLRPRDGRDDHRSVPQRRLAGLRRRRERRQVCLDFFGAGRFGGHQSFHRHVRGAVSLEQRLQQRLRWLRPNVSVTPANW